MRATNPTPSRFRAASERSLPPLSVSRLRGERGILSGSLVEPLIAIPLVTIVLLAAFMLLNNTMRTQARTRSQTIAYQNAQRAFDGVVRQLRTATQVTFLTTDVAIASSFWGSYTTGETNRLTATMVVTKPSGISSTPRDVTFKCFYATVTVIRVYQHQAGLHQELHRRRHHHLHLLDPAGRRPRDRNGRLPGRPSPTTVHPATRRRREPARARS